jgi:hypothetical protein
MYDRFCPEKKGLQGSWRWRPTLSRGRVEEDVGEGKVVAEICKRVYKDM